MKLQERLLELMKVPQGTEADIEREHYVREYIKQEIPNIKQDKTWNLYIINEWTPLICAHMDTVWSEEAQKNLDSIRLLDGIFSWTYNIWADDKCGIAIGMKLYEELWDKISILFTVWEEIWGLWIEEFDKELLSKVSYAIVPDRKWDSDIIWKHNHYCTEEFQDKIIELIEDYWYKPEIWIFSDANCISRYINVVNLSVWYYHAHTDNEFVMEDHFINAYEAIKNIVTNFNEKQDWPASYQEEYPIELLDIDMIEVNRDITIISETWKQIDLESWVYYILN